MSVSSTAIDNPPPAILNERDLAEVLGAFNDATSRLQGAHETLRGEVVRLKEELRDANAQIERSARLAALGEMAAGIAHEVRNPLGSIRLYGKILDDELADRPALRDVARKILASVRGLDAVVTDVLAFAREMRLHAEPTDAGEILDRAIAECAGLLDGDAAPRVQREVGRAKLSLVCDPSLVHRALVNLIRNAVEAMEHNPPARERVLTIGAARRRARASDGASHSMIALAVRDSGPGVSDEVRRRMFNPFFTTRAQGTGLGLAIVHRIADAHGGLVSVRNIPAGKSAIGDADAIEPAKRADLPGAVGGGGRARSRGAGTPACHAESCSAAHAGVGSGPGWAGAVVELLLPEQGFERVSEQGTEVSS